MRALDRGESFVITRSGVAVGELVPARRRTFVEAETVLAAFASAPRVDIDEFRSDLDDIVDQDPSPRA